MIVQCNSAVILDKSKKNNEHLENSIQVNRKSKLWANLILHLNICRKKLVIFPCVFMMRWETSHIDEYHRGFFNKSFWNLLDFTKSLNDSKTYDPWLSIHVWHLGDIYKGYLVIKIIKIIRMNVWKIHIEKIWCEE